MIKNVNKITLNCVLNELLFNILVLRSKCINCINFPFNLFNCLSYIEYLIKCLSV